MPSRRPSGHKVVRRRLADGTIKEYRYARAREPEAPKSGTLGALITAYRSSPEWRAKAPATQEQYRIYLRPWEDDRLWALPVTAIKRRDVLALRDAVAEARGNGAGTAFGRAASALFGWAVDRGWIDFSPAHRVRALPGGHLPAWSETHIERALEVLPEAYRRVVVLALYTGQRRGDLIRMTWSQVAAEGIRLRQQKTHEELLIPLHPELAKELAAWRAEGLSTVTILAAPRGQPWTPEHLSREMGKLCAKHGLPGLNVHGLRKAAARRLAEAGCSANEIASITGHRTLSMVQLYTRSADQGRMAQAAVFRLTGKRGKEG